jgi:hypothetical protein
MMAISDSKPFSGPRRTAARAMAFVQRAFGLTCKVAKVDDCPPWKSDPTSFHHYRRSPITWRRRNRHGQGYPNAPGRKPKIGTDA